MPRAARYWPVVPAVAFAIVGAVLFFAPGWSADRFAWRISDLLAMTMGGWYLGTSAFAWTVVRDARWTRMHAVLAYLWLFSLGQLALLLVHRDVVRTDTALAWLYVVAVAASAGACLVGAVRVAVAGPELPRGGEPMRWWVVVLLAGFVVAVALLALPLVDGYDSPRSIWPGELTLLSARAFAVFFGSLSLSAALLLVRRRLEPLVPYLLAGIALSGAILVAAALHIGDFDVVDHPGQLLYIGLYAFVLLASVALVVYARRRFAGSGVG